MTLQEALDKILAEINVLRKQADADVNYCKGASDSLKRLVDELNKANEDGTEEPKPEQPEQRTE